MKTTMMLFLLAMAASCNPVVALEDGDVPRLYKSASEYLSVVVPESKVKKMAKSLESRIRQRVEERDMSEDTAMRTVMVDWAADNIDSLDRKDPDTVARACFYFKIFVDKGYAFPSNVSSRLTPDVVKDIIFFLDGEVERKK